MSSHSAPAGRASTVTFFVLLAGYAGWMLSLPAWPSQDGPVHLYYTHVLDTLFAKSSTVYQPYLFIKHLLPPYAVYYYTLLVLSHFVSLLTADRLVVCGYMVSFALGFRFAAKATGPGYRWTSPLACGLLLNWSLGMGFVNYCLSLSFALWAMGLWLRFTDAPQWGKRLTFLGLLVLITLSHPVPLLIVLAFGGLDLLCRYAFAGGREHRQAVLRGSAPNLLTLGCGALCLAYVKAFTVANPLAQRTAVRGGPLHQIARRIAQIATAKALGLLYGHWWQVLAYRAGLVLLLIVPGALALLQFRRNRRGGGWTGADTCSVSLVLLAVALPLLPSDLSGAYFFSERLTVMLWILALLAASGWRPAADPSPASTASGAPASSPGERVVFVACVCALGFSALLLHLANICLRPLAEQQRLLSSTVLPLGARRTLVLDGDDPPRGFKHIAPSWNAFEWNTVALLRRNEGVLENAPWLDSPIIPLAPAAALRGAFLPRLLANSPFELRSAAGASPSQQPAVLPGVDAVLFSPVTAGLSVDARRAIPATWSCTAPGPPGFRLCTPPREEPRP